jgi:microcystin-dependent protein
MVLSGNDLEITDAGGTLSVDLSSLADDDADSTNELQSLGLSGASLSISDGNSVDLTSLVGAAGNGSGTIGEIVAFSGGTVPYGYLACDGSAVSRTVYANLFLVTGTAWGVGNGSTTFNLPDLRGRFIRGVNAGSGNDPDATSRTAIHGGNTGDNVGSYQGDRLKSHRHKMHDDSPQSFGTIKTSAAFSGTNTSNFYTGYTGGSETRPKNANVQFIIRYMSTTGIDTAQTLAIVGNVLSISNGNSVTLPAQDNDVIRDADNDTKIHVELNTDDDLIRFYNNGNQKWIMRDNTLENYNSGVSVFIGRHAGQNDDLTSNQNVFVGEGAGQSNTSGAGNTFTGTYAGNLNTTAGGNTFNGYQAGTRTTTGSSNTFVGEVSGNTNSTGHHNTAIGSNSLRFGTSAWHNTGLGFGAGSRTTTGNTNTFVGSQAGMFNTTGSQNTYLGVNAGVQNATGSRNVFIGNAAGANSTGSDELYIDNSNTATPLVYGDFASNHFRVNGSARVTALSGTGTRMVVADANGDLQTQTIPTGGDNLGNHTASNNLNMTNRNIFAVNNMEINDPGANEGINFRSTAANWRIDVSPVNRANSDGNLNLYGTTNNIVAWRPLYRHIGGTLYKYWNEANDGAGSGLHADLLDGRHGAFYLDNTDNQSLSSASAGTNRTINISGGSGTTINVADNDNNSSNEIQLLGLSGSILSISGGNAVNLASVGGDNLGNHTATTALNMSGRDITNVREHYMQNWIRWNDNDGLYWGNNGHHIYPRSSVFMNFRSGHTSEGGLALMTQSTTRGFLRASDNSIGIANTVNQMQLYTRTADGYSPNRYFIENGNETWSGNPGNDIGKIEYHSNRFYLASGANSTEIVRFRRSGSDVARVDNSGYIHAPRFYDWNNSSYYIDPASQSYVNDFRANIIYDRQNTAFYVDPASTTRLNTVRAATLAGTGTRMVTADANGQLSTQAIPVSGGGDEIKDADNDTKIQVEFSADDDLIRFYTTGSQRWIMRGRTFESYNSGGSVFIGRWAGEDDDNSLNRNVFVGEQAGRNTTSGDFNVYIGNEAGKANTTGHHNNFIGNAAGAGNTTGNRNNFMGDWSGINNTTGYYNTFIGDGSGVDNTVGWGNAYTGRLAGAKNQVGDRNTFMGNGSGYNNINDNNTGIGFQAGLNGTNWINRTALGYNTQNTGSNQVRVGNAAVGSIGGFADWSNVSDVNFKSNVSEDVHGLEFILKLRPVTYNLNMDAIANFYGTSPEDRDMDSEAARAQEVQTGFIAQEVETAAQELGYEFSGVDAPQGPEDHYGLRYAQFVVPLVKAVQEQQATIEAQEARLTALEQGQLSEEELEEIKQDVRDELKEEYDVEMDAMKAAILTLSNCCSNNGLNVEPQNNNGNFLYQNVPNPFLDRTTIPYRLGETGLATIAIFKEDGTLVTTLVSEVQEPGEYTVDWDAKDAAAGVYVYTLTVNNTLISLRMISLK